ncbi:MAG: ATP-binding cassette domain-containing protein [Desulfobulbaceae bacterium]|nr:ATP-binding cassette domain-containing protein [Desulfobulbaceae bacterium]
MDQNTVALDIPWIAQRCCSLHEKVLQISPRQMAAIQQAVVQQTGADHNADHQIVVEQLFEMLELGEPEWVEEPSSDALPMLALLPGIGGRLVYGRTDQGHWLLEGPAGSHRIVHVPPGSLFASIPRPTHSTDAHPGALSVFKEALASRKTVFIQAALASALCNVFALATSLYSLQVYDRVIPTQGIQTLIVLTSGVSIVMVLDMIIKMARSAILENFIKGADREISHKIFHRLLGVRMDQFPASVGNLSSQIRSYESIRSFASSATLYVAIDAPFGLLFLLVIMGIAGPLVALVALVFFLLSIALGLIFRRRIELHTKNSAALTNQKLGLLVETVEGAESVKASGAGWQMLARWDRLNRDSVDDDAQTRRYSETSSYLAGFMQQMSYVMLVGTGAYLAATTTDLTTGGIIACSILSGRVLAPIGMLPGLIVQWGHAKIALENLEKVFALERDNHEIARPLSPDVINGSYQVSKLRFAYRGRQDTLTIDRLVIAPGEKVGILGVVGAGKSTLLKLLAGLYKPEQGQILLDGLDLQHISRLSLSEHVGYLPQNIHLFAGTVRDNLLLGITGVTEAEVLAACETTGLMGLITSHPKGLDLEIAEGGAGVSGGQKQLIALTRLLLSRPDIWLLDEPTASMDEGCEQRVLAGIKRTITPEQTLVLVTHKPILLGLVNRLVILTPTGIAMDGPRDAVLEQLRKNSPAAPPQAVNQGR